MRSNERLARLLFIVPYAATRDGVPVAELADKLDITRAQLLRDLDLLMMVGQPPLTPDHLIDIYVEDNRVYVELDQNLSRPLRLSHDEGRALVLAAKLVGSLGGLGRELDGIVNQLLELLNPVDADLVRALGERIALSQDHDSDAEPVALLRKAVESRREVTADYYSVSSDRKKSYVLQPLALLSHTGAEYLVALDTEANLREKLFRLDRMSQISLTERHFEAPAQVDLERYRTRQLYSGSPEEGAVVRFTAKVAPVVLERFGRDRASTGADGSVEVRLTTSSAAWLARWVLPFGADAEIISPPQQRQAMLALCRNAAAAYQR